jgi:hypothetical protein
MTPNFVSVLALRKLARVNFDGERVVWFLRFFIPNMEPAHDIQAYLSLLSDGNLTEVCILSLSFTSTLTLFFSQAEEIENKLSSFLFETILPNYDDLYDELKKQGIRKVCQYQFRKNDIVWICRSCQTDETCVLCNDCFQDSSHEGHEVYFYHSQAGGCCDCGDGGAWKPEGFCSKHGHEISDPLIGTPDKIKKTAQVLLHEISNYLLRYCQQSVETYNLYSLPTSPHELYSVRLHNDDVHTLPEVITILQKVWISLSISPSEWFTYVP